MSHKIQKLTIVLFSVVHGLFYFLYLLTSEYYQNDWIMVLKEEFNSRIVLQLCYVSLYLVFGWLIAKYNIIPGRLHKLLLYLPNLIIVAYSIVFNFYLKAWVIESETGLYVVDRAMKMWLLIYMIITMPLILFYTIPHIAFFTIGYFVGWVKLKNTGPTKSLYPTRYQINTNEYDNQDKWQYVMTSDRHKKGK